MDFNTIINQLNDLPKPFRRDGQPYTWLIDALAAGLYLLCQSADSIQPQYNFNTSTGGFIDIWGAISNFIRSANESDNHYQNRIENTILAWRDSLVAIEEYTQNVEGTPTLVTETFPVGYTIYFTLLQDLNQIFRIVSDLRYIRPAGVPFLVRSQIGTYLNTVNYYGHVGVGATPTIGRVTGAYLTDNEPLQLNILASTNSAEDLLPDLLFTAPILNS